MECSGRADQKEMIRESKTVIKYRRILWDAAVFFCGTKWIWSVYTGVSQRKGGQSVCAAGGAVFWGCLHLRWVAVF